MKKFKKLIPAFCMLLVSAVLLGSSTYAWFSMNKEVTATGMQITANSDSVFLVINAGDSFKADNTEKAATSVASATNLKPVSPVNVISSATAATAVTTPANWHYAYSNSNDSSAAATAYQTLTALTGYVSSETFYIGLNEKSGAESASNLKVKSITLPENTGISVVLVCGEKVAVATGDVLAESVTTTGVAVTVYYYINGEDTNVTTDNANLNQLKGTVTITFEVD